MRVAHKREIQRVLHLKNKIKHKIKEFTLVLESLILIKNLVIELLVDKKMKPCYLGLMVVIRWLKEGAYILAELDRSV